jgi:hypothetical protein
MADTVSDFLLFLSPVGTGCNTDDVLLYHCIINDNLSAVRRVGISCCPEDQEGTTGERDPDVHYLSVLKPTSWRECEYTEYTGAR